MALRPVRLNVMLDPEHAQKLARLSARVHLHGGTLARSLLSGAIDEADPDARTVVEVLDALPGTWARAQLGLDHARRGDTRVLDDL